MTLVSRRSATTEGSHIVRVNGRDMTALLRGGVVAAALATPSGIAPLAAVPSAWVAYGSQVGSKLQAWLADAKDEKVGRLHAFLDETASAARAKPVSAEGIIVRVWIARDGRVSRATFETLGSAAADADLQGILLEHALPAPPPDMRQPLVVRLRLTPPATESPA